MIPIPIIHFIAEWASLIVSKIKVRGLADPDTTNVILFSYPDILLTDVDFMVIMDPEEAIELRDDELPFQP